MPPRYKVVQYVPDEELEMALNSLTSEGYLIYRMYRNLGVECTTIVGEFCEDFVL